ncbi:MAG: formate-dependent phosphoribosylglycinamide formyltransferase [Rhodobacteraceae bacterium]|nr:formate-dependent phosphoribosylglycinamide formyltransferase [Paracoccaceae bacterium]OUU62553.1 MAG: phosphoribosylglycinamide formyltransferase 2 [Alphaproteobacteria bacterium TMED62]|tara:strand:+ start:4508 stop:5659 length:1152 start_codon:yes stop_codon:yes gene_type:complete
MKKILLLGSGELGKELVISAKRLGCEVIACDKYSNAPAMQVADISVVLDMLDGKKLLNLVNDVKPDFIVPEIESIRTEELFNIENKGITVVPSARAVNLTMNRDAIRDRANELGIKTAKYEYAHNINELDKAVQIIGLPCIVKPVMSSSGKGQTLLTEKKEISYAWENATKNMRGDRIKVIVEEYINFESEITLLTVRQSNRDTIFCPPIGHKQEGGDYVESWQPENMDQDLLMKAKDISEKITKDLGGNGLFGIEFFITKNDIIFSELSPRPHDTGMVTLYTQNLSEFDLHIRAILSYPINEISILREGYSTVIKADGFADRGFDYKFSGIEKALELENVDIRLFGKPKAWNERRMGVILSKNRKIGQKARKLISIHKKNNY